MRALAPPHLLILDDDPDILTLLQVFLQGEGYRVTSAASLPASLGLLKQQLFQFILTDLFAQRREELLASIHPLLVEAAPVPVGVMTAWNMPAEAAAPVGLACLLPKPFSLEMLLQAVEVGLQPATGTARLCCLPEVVLVTPAARSVAEDHHCTGLERLRGCFERRFLALPGYTVEEIGVFAHPLRLVARYIARWQGGDGLIHRVAGSLQFRFQGERIAQLA